MALLAADAWGRMARGDVVLRESGLPGEATSHEQRKTSAEPNTQAPVAQLDRAADF